MNKVYLRNSRGICRLRQLQGEAGLLWQEACTHHSTIEDPLEQAASIYLCTTVWCAGDTVCCKLQVKP